MTEILLHIGTPKTGTTSLQRFLHELEGPLRERGILYPLASRDEEVRFAHHRLVWSITGRFGYDDDRCWRDLREELEAVRPALAVVSCEDFALFHEEEIERVAGYVEGCRLRVVVYLRNQLDFIVSQYKQRVKSANWQYRHSFRRFLDEHSDQCDYAALLDRWSATFGADAVEFRLYDKVRRTSGLEPDFLERIGARDLVDHGRRSRALHSANVSPSDESTFALRLLNSAERLAPEWGLARRVCHGARKRLMQPDSSASRMLSAMGRALLPRVSTPRDIEFLREKTRAFNERFFPRLDEDDRRWFEF